MADNTSLRQRLDRRLGDLKTIRTEQHAQWQLEQREGPEIGGGEKAQLGGGEPQVLHQVGRHHGVHRAQQVGHEVAGGEGQQGGEDEAKQCHDCNTLVVIRR